MGNHDPNAKDGGRPAGRRGRPSVRNPYPEARATRKTAQAASPEEKVKVAVPEVLHTERKTVPSPETVQGHQPEQASRLFLALTLHKWLGRPETLGLGAHDLPLADHSRQLPALGGRGLEAGPRGRGIGLASLPSVGLHSLRAVLASTASTRG